MVWIGTISTERGLKVQMESRSYPWGGTDVVRTLDMTLYYYSERLIGKFNILSQQSNYSTSFYNNKNVMLVKPEFFTAQIIEGIVVESKEKTLLINIYYRN